jgi:PRC-barrel domain
MATMTTRDTQSGLESPHTNSLIGSDNVEGTAVYGADNQRIGDVKRVMIDKTSGKVAYAVLSFGGFLGLGEDHYPVPWSTLNYDTNLGGYRTNLTAEMLKSAPKYTQGTDWNWSRENDRKVYDHYQAKPYWEYPGM